MPITRQPLRLRIQIALTDLLKGINPDNGYEFDLRDSDDGLERVVRGRLEVGNDEPLPMVTINEPALVPDPVPTKHQVGNTARVSDWDLIIQGWAAANGANVTDRAYQLEAEVSRRLAGELAKTQTGRPGARNILGFGDAITSMAIGSPVVRPNEHVSEQGVFYLVLTLNIAEDMAEPLG